jgi:hypothetical protein
LAAAMRGIFGLFRSPRKMGRPVRFGNRGAADLPAPSDVPSY